MERGIEVSGPITAARQAAIEALLAQRELAPRWRERLEMVKAAWLGEDIATIARWSGRTPRTVRRWLAAFRVGGVAALAQAVATPPRSLGLPCDVWTSARLSAYLVEQTGTRIAPGWPQVLLHRERFARGRPKHPLHHLQDPTEVIACIQRLQAAGGKGGGAAGALRVAL